MWPKTTALATAAWMIGSSETMRAIAVIAAPFPKSAARTMSAAALPDVRNTLVDPVRPLPTARMSTPRVRRTT